MVKDHSIKLIAMLARKILLQKRIVKYQQIIEVIDEYVDDHLESSRNIKDFQLIFDKLKSEYKHHLIDTSEEEDDDDNDNDNDTDNNDTKMEQQALPVLGSATRNELVKSKNDK
jgi:anionic cell wall polymer biosynthesis LytR-Cps2A-Psr (LCP) family protein